MTNQTQKFILPFFISLVFCPIVSSAENISASRDEFIREKLDCVTQTDESQWDQLCSLGSNAAVASREDIINQALDSVGHTESAPEKPAALQVSSTTERQVNHSNEAPLEYSAHPLSAQNLDEEDFEETSPAILLKPHEVTFGSEIYRYSYKEPVFNLEIKGLQFGVFGAYTYRPSPGDALRSEVLNMYRIDARFAAGPVDYSSNGSGQLDNEDNHVFELRGLAGYDHFVNEQFLLTGYLGLGFRYLNNDSGGRQSTTGAYGYERVSNYFYLPVGIETVHQITSQWRIASNLEWDIFLYGEQTSYLSDVSSSYPDIENNQNRGYGIRASVRIVKAGTSTDLFLEPFVRYWRIHDSQITTAVGNGVAITALEPDNSTAEYGFKLGLEY